MKCAVPPDLKATSVRIPSDRFEQWAESVYPDPPYSFAKLVNLSGLSRSTMFYQRSRGYLDARVLIIVARKIGRNPLEELLQFPEFSTLASGPPPTTAEVLSQLPVPAMMEELLGRYWGYSVTHDLESRPGRYNLNRWLASYDVRGRYKELAQAAGVSGQQEFSRKLTENRFSLEQLLALSEHGGLNARFSLVASGVISYAEAGFNPNLREETLAQASTGAIVAELKRALPWFAKEMDAAQKDKQ